jgi:tRNA dimethylallyltransferase
MTFPSGPDLPPLVAIVGPTAVGKTECAIQLAERTGAEIVSADSRLFYRNMDIGTAKPTLEERQRVRHHLIDGANPDEVWNLTLFQEQARRAIDEIHSRGRLPLLVGGTGQYFRAVVEGWQPPSAQPDERLRATLQDWAAEIGPEGLHTRLAILDSPAAAQIDARNLRRTIRALEVILTTGRRFSEQRRRQPAVYHLLVLGLTRPRTELYARIDARIQVMLEAGWVEEVRALLADGYSPELPTLSAIGYAELVRYVRGEISLDEAVTSIKRRTRIFVRRQSNWFRPDDPAIHWFQAGPDTWMEMEQVVRREFYQSGG